LGIHFSKEDMSVASKHLRIHSCDTTNREIQIKTTVRDHFISPSMAIITIIIP
jgi:ribosomal protein S19